MRDAALIAFRKYVIPTLDRHHRDGFSEIDFGAVKVLGFGETDSGKSTDDGIGNELRAPQFVVKASIDSRKDVK